MTFSTESAKARLEQLKLGLADSKKKEAAKAAGFDRLDDYDQWLVLEDLRKTTLEIAKRKADKKRKPPTGYATGGSISVGHVDCGRVTLPRSYYINNGSI